MLEGANVVNQVINKLTEQLKASDSAVVNETIMSLQSIIDQDDHHSYRNNPEDSSSERKEDSD